MTIKFLGEGENAKVKRLMILFCLVLLATFSISFYAFAGTWGPLVSWSVAGSTYSPYKGYGQIYEYTDSSGQLKISTKARNIFFSTSAVNSIKNYYTNGYQGTKPLYYTFDISVDNDYDTTLSAFNYWVSNFPGAYFDIDDDPEPWGNGYNDETEVVSLQCYNINATTAYYFESYFKVVRKPSRTSPTVIAFSSQESYPHWSGEYDTKLYCTHVRLKYPW